MKKHPPIKNFAEAKKIINNIKMGIQDNALTHIFPRDIIEQIACESDPFEKIMEDREELITKAHRFLDQINSLEIIMGAAERGNIDGLDCESVGKDYLEFQKTAEIQLNELQILFDLMHERIQKTLELFTKQMREDGVESK